jgi:hypothetical protein
VIARPELYVIEPANTRQHGWKFPYTIASVFPMAKPASASDDRFLMAPLRGPPSSPEYHMTNDADWVADVRRWVNAGAQRPSTVASPSVVANDDLDVLGYEAAHPALQALNWPDAPGSGFIDLV